MKYKVVFISEDMSERTKVLSCKNRKEALEIAISISNISGEQLASLKPDPLSYFTKKIKFTEDDIAIFCKYLSILISAGVRIDRAISILKNRYKNRVLKKEISLISRSMSDGNSLGFAIRESNIIFPAIFHQMIEVSEYTGDLSSVLKYLSEYYQDMGRFRKEYIYSLIYPFILIFVVIAVFIVLMKFVIPDFLDMFESSGVDPPQITKAVFILSLYFQRYSEIAIILLTILITFLYKLYSNRKINFVINKFLIKAPLIGNLIININSMQFSKSLYMMFSSGISIQEALKLSYQHTKNHIYRNSYRNILSSIEDGNSLYISVKDEKCYSDVLKTLILIGEESGELENSFLISSEFIEQELSNSLKKIIKFSEPILIIFISLMIMGLIFAVFLPILDIYSNFE